MTNPASDANSKSAPSNAAQATFGGGCFWCVEAIFHRLRGVLVVESGYCNGSHPNPSYEDVCGGETGHAEVIRLHFDPAQISYRQLLEVFFAAHDPTTLNRQGNDVGTQYRSAIFTHDVQQSHEARAFIEHLTQMKIYGDTPIVTEVAPVANYHRAEDYHQLYFERHPYQGYCAVVIAPKVDKFQQAFHDLLRPEGS
jgi:peptide-methionine (S)-S-oxide reductase